VSGQRDSSSLFFFRAKGLVPLSRAFSSLCFSPWSYGGDGRGREAPSFCEGEVCCWKREESAFSRRRVPILQDMTVLLETIRLFLEGIHHLRGPAQASLPSLLAERISVVFPSNDREGGPPAIPPSFLSSEELTLIRC